MARRQQSRYIQYYVGTAAPKLVPQPKKNKTTLPKEYKQQSYTIHVDPLALGGIVVSVVMLILMMVGIVQLASAQKDLNRMTEYVNSLQAQNVQLEQDYYSRYDLETVEKAALSMGMIPAEEAQHITISVPAEETWESSFWGRFHMFLEGLFA